LTQPDELGRGGEGERKEVNLSLRGMAPGQGAAGLAIGIRKFS
jgi:hypothetical protein